MQDSSKRDRDREGMRARQRMQASRSRVAGYQMSYRRVNILNGTKASGSPVSIRTSCSVVHIVRCCTDGRSWWPEEGIFRP